MTLPCIKAVFSITRNNMVVIIVSVFFHLFRSKNKLISNENMCRYLIIVT